MGTKARIVFYAREGGAGERALDRVAELEAVMSDYRKDSEVMRLCAKAGGPPVRVSDDLFAVMAYALSVSEQSDGAFDITVGPLTHALRAGRQPGTAEHALVGWHNVDLGPGTVRLKKRGMLLDLGGLGKGYAADQALWVLWRLGITRALVDLGGDIVVGDPPPGESGWRVEINGRVRRIKNRAVAGSGGAHILDPRTGRPIEDGRRVTVVAPTGIQADAWASAICVIGESALVPSALSVYFAERTTRKPTNSPSASHQMDRGR